MKKSGEEMTSSPLSSLGSSGESVIGKLFGCEVENSSLCRCGKETVRTSLTLLFTIHYPEHNSQGSDSSVLVCHVTQALTVYRFPHHEIILHIL